MMRASADPSVSVVIETVNLTANRALTGAGLDDLWATLEAIAQQTYPSEHTDVLVVVDRSVAGTEGAAIEARHPWVRVVAADTTNYFEAKNAGVATARAPLVAFTDSDCVPEPSWLEQLVARFEPGIDAVAGRIRYAGSARASAAKSVLGFGHVVTAPTGDSTGLNLSNVAFRRDVFMQFGLDARLHRNGGCTLLYHRLRASGRRVAYAPDATVAHGADDLQGLGILRKHFARGRDSVDVYRVDEGAVLGGTMLFRRFGALALPGIALRRICRDLVHLLRQRRQLGVSLAAVPYVGALGVGLRLVELAGMLSSAIRPRPLRDPAPDG